MSHTLFFPADKIQNDTLLGWAASRIPWMAPHSNMKAVGVNAGPSMDDPLLAVCIYHNFTETRIIDGKPWYGLCEISFAAGTPKWATRRTISNLLRIPFLQYNCRKVSTVIPSTNKRAIRFNEGIGLKHEGSLRHHFAKSVHACVHGMMRSEFEKRWRNPVASVRLQPGSQAHGQVHSVSTVSA